MRAAEPHAGSQRYVTLDALRGFAAICVALYHLDRPLAPHGFLAVDIFFALSGFVLFRAYVPRFAAGMTALQFLRLRWLRLYPLFLVGALLSGGLVLVLTIARGAEPSALWTLLGSLMANLAFLPSPFSNELFPTNTPAWSLFFELCVNLLLVLLFPFIVRGRLILFALLAAAVLVAVAFHGRTEFETADLRAYPLSAGWTWTSMAMGWARSLFSFAIGLLIALMTQNGSRPATWCAMPVLGLVVVLLCLDVPSGAELGYSLLVVLVLSPVIVLAGSRIDPPALLRRASTACGDVSFALYAIHAPLAEVTRRIGIRFGIDMVWLAAIYLAVALGLAWVLTYHFDTKVRARLATLSIWGRRKAESAPSGAA